MEAPDISIRSVSSQTDLSYHAVRDIMKKDLNFKPWKPRYVQELHHEDMDRRIEFAETMLELSERRPDIFKKLIWSDEAIFHLGGFVNKHNCHYWAIESPPKLFKKSQRKPKVTVWAAITSEELIGPVIIEETMNGERYQHYVLEDTLFPKMEEIDPDDEYMFMQDGAPAHYSTAVRACLDERLPGRWLGRRGPFEWPARSCDLTPCDFFLWGWAKEEVYRRNPKDIEELKTVIKDVLTNVPIEMLQKSVSEEVPRRLKKLIDRDGGYVEI